MRKDVVSDNRVKALLRDDIDPAAEKLPDAFAEFDEAESTAPGDALDQQIDVTVGASLAASELTATAHLVPAACLRVRAAAFGVSQWKRSRLSA